MRRGSIPLVSPSEHGVFCSNKKKDGAGAPSLSGADWLLVNRQTTISEV
jgi:hypothetical protein